MQNNKRIIPKFIKRLFVVILAIVFIAVFSKIIFSYLYDEDVIVKDYKIQEEKCKLLKSIPKEVVRRDGIKINLIDTEQVKYRIYNDDENIIFYYYLKDDYKYEATITLSNKYEILNEEYSIEIEEFEEYKNDSEKFCKIISVYVGVMIVGIAVIIHIICSLIKAIKKHKNNNLSI